MNNFSNLHRLEPALDYAEGTGSRLGAVIDTKGYDSVAFIVRLNAVAAGSNHSVVAQTGNEADGSDMADITPANHSVSEVDAGAIKLLDLTGLSKRYVRLSVTKDGANSSAESAIVALYGGQLTPVEQSSWTDSKYVHVPLAG